MCDPRAGKNYADRQPSMLIQSWKPTAELFWELGVRWHPELATKWLKGGGQFQVAEVVNEPPEEMTLEKGAEEVLEFLAESQPELVETIKNLRENGSEADKKAAMDKFQADIKNIVKIAEYIQGQTS